MDGKLSENGNALHSLHCHVNNLLEFEAQQNHVPGGLKDPKVGSESTNSKKYILLRASGKSLIGTKQKRIMLFYLLPYRELFICHILRASSISKKTSLERVFLVEM